MSRPPPESGCQEPAKLACLASASLWRIAVRNAGGAVLRKVKPVKSEGYGRPALAKDRGPAHRLKLAYHGGRRVDGGAEFGDRCCNVRPAHARSIRDPERPASGVAESGRIARQHAAAVAMSAAGHERLPAPLSALGEAMRRSPQPVGMPRGGRLATTWPIVAVAAFLICGAGHILGPGLWIGFDSGSGERWRGRYERVGSAALSEEAARVSLEHLAVLPRRDEERPGGRRNLVGADVRDRGQRP
jgi:hypothetical protein